MGPGPPPVLPLERRLEMLENQCSVWPDPIAAVAHIPTLNGRIFSPDDASLNGIHLGEAVERVTAFYERLQLQGGAGGIPSCCQLCLCAVWESLRAASQSAAEEPPVCPRHVLRC
jgi:hypothetical protein